MAATLDGLIHHHDDHILIIDLGQADKVALRVESLGKSFESMRREPVIV